MELCLLLPAIVVSSCTPVSFREGERAMVFGTAKVGVWPEPWAGELLISTLLAGFFLDPVARDFTLSIRVGTVSVNACGCSGDKATFIAVLFGL